MPLVKLVCPKCSNVYAIDPERKVQRCPICGAPLFEGEEVDIPDLTAPSDIDSLEVALSHGFRLLYFRSYDHLFDFAKLMRGTYPDEYWTYMFELIGKTGIDFIFLIPKVDYQLSKEEIEEDMRSRVYHYARKKYSKSPQLTFNKIAGYYPDLPGNNRKKWKKARTKYEEKNEMVEHYSEVAAMIRSEYLYKLDELAKTEDQKHINHNLKVWLDQVAHAKIDLYRYNQSAETYVRDDYDKTPNPGNKPLFTGFLIFYSIALITFILSIIQIVLTIVNSDLASNRVLLYTAASIYTFLILLSGILLIAGLGYIRQHPVMSVIAITVLTLICGSGIATAGFNVRINWFAIFAALIALVALFFTSIKLVKYLPHKSAVGTIIGDFPKLADNSFELSFVFAFKNYEGEDPEEILFSENWINGK